MTAFNFTSSSALYSLARDLHDDIIVYTRYFNIYYVEILRHEDHVYEY